MWRSVLSYCVDFSVLDPDDFIVDEEGQSVVKKKKKKTIIHDDK